MSDLKIKSVPELKQLLSEAEGSLARLRFQAAARRLKNVRALPKTRRTIARIRTLLSKTSV